jgi:hypothetical protein
VDIAEELHRNRARYESEIARLREGRWDDERLSSEQEDAIRETVERIRRFGAQCILYASPNFNPNIYMTPYRHAMVRSVRERWPEIPLLEYTDPARYPTLYNLDLWRDRGHLNVDGATLQSEIFGRELARLMRGLRSGPPVVVGEAGI